MKVTCTEICIPGIEKDMGGYLLIHIPFAPVMFVCLEKIDVIYVYLQLLVPRNTTTRKPDQTIPDNTKLIQRPDQTTQNSYRDHQTHKHT